jgi:predicted ABC-type ATPase
VSDFPCRPIISDRDCVEYGQVQALVIDGLAAGMQVLFVYVVLGSVDEAIGRVATRVSEGGHDVPEKKIRKRWSRSLKNVRWFWDHATRSLVYFNGNATETPIQMAEREGDKVGFVLSAPAPWAVSNLLPSWRGRSRPSSAFAKGRKGPTARSSH